MASNLWGTISDFLKHENKNKDVYYRVKRYDASGNHLTKLIKQRWVYQAAKDKEPFSVQCVFGEINNNVYVIKDAIEKSNCGSIEIIFGPKLANRDTKENLKYILEMSKDKSDKIKIYSLNKRPLYHSVRIKNNYIYEDKHGICEPSKWSTVILNASDNTKKVFQDNFNKLLDENESIRVTLDNIDEIPVDEIADYNRCIRNLECPKVQA